MTTFLRHRLWPAIALLIVMTVVTGFLYPLAVTAVAQVAFPHQANGSFIVTADGRTIGSSLIGQAFDDPKYFSGRPSAAGADGYDASRVGGIEPRPDEPEADRPGRRRRSTRCGRPTATSPIPVDLVTTSGVGARSRHQPGGGRVPGRARRKGTRRCPRPMSGPPSPATRSSRCSGSSASHGSTS